MPIDTKMNWLGSLLVDLDLDTFLLGMCICMCMWCDVFCYDFFMISFLWPIQHQLWLIIIRRCNLFDITKNHRGIKGILLFFQNTQALQSRGVVALFHLFTIAIYGRNCSDMQHWSLLCDNNIEWPQVTCLYTEH